MKPRSLLFLFVAAPLAAGELPYLTKQPWLGQYAGTETRDFRFMVKVNGEALVIPSREKGGFIADRFAIKLVPLIEDTLPNGKMISKLAAKDAWEAVTPAAEDPKKITYRGTVAGDATFEVNIELDGGKITAGGRLLEKGKLVNPRFVIRVQVSNVYQYDTDPKKREEKLKKDRIDLVRADGKKLKLDVNTPMDAESDQFNGPGITQARIEMAGYAGHKVETAAGAAGVFQFWNRGEAALYQGFTLGWRHDAAKDPEGKGRLTFELR